MKFSERLHLAPVKPKMQKNDINEELRTKLWNILDRYYWSRSTGPFYFTYNIYQNPLQNPIYQLAINIQENYFIRTVDELGNEWGNLRSYIKKYFFEETWYKVYDFIEFLLGTGFVDPARSMFLRKDINKVLEEECAAYRLVGNNRFIPIVSDLELESVNQCMKSNPYEQVRRHIEQAMLLLSDRKNPDYRNSVKESISAVEAICKILTGDERATLDKAIKKLSDHGINMHKAFETSMIKLYGYTSDADGIRHCIKDKPKVDFADAKYMLVACSAFCNFLMDKSRGVR